MTLNVKCLIEKKTIQAAPCQGPWRHFITGHRVLLPETICVSPVVFLVFAAWETPGSGRSEGERGRASHDAKALRKQGARACWKKKHSVIGYVTFLLSISAGKISVPSI